jgi:uncharacterized protein (UPF0332 family)
MPVSDLQILDLANEMLRGKTEAHWRTSASSAYFAVFHCANRLGDAVMPGRKLKTAEHKKLTERLRRSGPLGSALAYQIGKLKYQRVRADYRLGETFTKVEAENQLRLARDVMSATARLMADFPTLVEAS